jgi:hypothetical protein
MRKYVLAAVASLSLLGAAGWAKAPARDAKPDSAEFSDCDEDHWPRVDLADRQGSSKPHVD